MERRVFLSPDKLADGGVCGDDGQDGVLNVFSEPFGLFGQGMPDQVSRDANGVAMQSHGKRVIESTIRLHTKRDAFAIKEVQVLGGWVKGVSEQNQKSGGLVVPAGFGSFLVVLSGCMEDVTKLSGAEHFTGKFVEFVAKNFCTSGKKWRNLAGLLDQCANVFGKTDGFIVDLGEDSTSLVK